MKKHLLLLFAALLPLVASAEKVEINGIWYNLVSKAKQAEVTYKGDSYDSYYDEYSGSINIPATVTYDGVAYSVTSIGESAFEDCSSLTAITLPASVTSIGGIAFNGCESLTDVYCNAEEIPHTSTNAFSGSNIENATLHVPASAMDEYKNTAPWSSFGTIKAIEKGGTTGILTIPAKPVLIQCQGGVITLSGLDEGTEVAVFTANGTAVTTATATNGTATLTTNLTAGTIAIVKTGDYSIKVAIK